MLRTLSDGTPYQTLCCQTNIAKPTLPLTFPCTCCQDALSEAGENADVDVLLRAVLEVSAAIHQPMPSTSPCHPPAHAIHQPMSFQFQLILFQFPFCKQLCIPCTSACMRMCTSTSMYDHTQPTATQHVAVGYLSKPTPILGWSTGNRVGGITQHTTPEIENLCAEDQEGRSSSG